MTKLESQLQEMGLSQTESKIYLGLLKNGKSTVLQLSKAVKMNRTTTHLAIQTLREKGLVNDFKNANKRIIAAEPPEMFKYIIEQEKNQIKRKESTLKTLINSLNLEIEDLEENTKNSITFLQGKEQVFKIYEDALKAIEVYSFCDLEKYYNIYPDSQPLYYSSLNIIKNRNVYDILLDNEFNRSMGKFHERYHIKYVNQEEYLAVKEFGDYMIFDGKVGIVEFKENNSVNAIYINSKFVYNSFRALHRTMCQLL
jgi:sugar-specific transcriptional regulator TrmB